MANWCFCYCEVEGPEESRKKFFEELNDFIQYMGSEELSNRALSTKIEGKDISRSNDKVKEWKESHQLKIEGHLFYTEVMGDAAFQCNCKWSPSDDAFQSMTASYPDLVITVGWDESGNNIGGRSVYANGEIISEESGESESNGGCLETFAKYVLVAATLPLHEIMNLITIDWNCEMEIDDTNVDGEIFKKVMSWVLERGEGLPSTKKGRTRKLLKELKGVARISYAPNWTGMGSNGIRDDKELFGIWDKITGKTLKAEQEEFRNMVNDFFN